MPQETFAGCVEVIVVVAGAQMLSEGAAMKTVLLWDGPVRPGAGSASGQN